MSSEIKLYLHTLIFGLIVFGLTYGYITYLQIPGQLNKSVADTAIILIGWSMLLSSVCYFWNFLDKLIIYRKYLGLIGFAFAITHIILSYTPLLKLFSVEAWQTSVPWAPLAGLIATIIFTVMALISNTYMAAKLGGRRWKFILRTGYVAVVLIAIHVVVLKSGRWINWYNEGMTEAPSMSILVTVFMMIVLLMRIVLWIVLKGKKVVKSATPISSPTVSQYSPTQPAGQMSPEQVVVSEIQTPPKIQ